MARPKHTNPEHFTSGEISHGTGISMRNLQVIRDNGLAPEGGQWLPSGLWDLSGMVHFALIAAFTANKAPLLHSAKLAQELLYTHSDFGFGYLSRVEHEHYGQKLEIWTPATENFDFDFWYHHALRTRYQGIYRRSQAWRGDHIFLIADGKYTALDVHDPIHRLGTSWGKTTIEPGPDPFCIILPEADPSGSLVSPVYEDPRMNVQTGEFDIAVLDEYRAAIYNAVNLNSINLSVAVRNCADRIHDLRMSKGGTIFTH